MRRRWLQVPGDPSVRRFLFEQERVPSACDAHLDEVLHRLELLITDHGVFHARIDFAGSLVTLWDVRDPLTFRLHASDELLEPAALRAYPSSLYPARASVPRLIVGALLAEFRRLRLQDPQLYLRSASLHVVTGVVGLTFSCDGSHYLDYAYFLRHAHTLFAPR